MSSNEHFNHVDSLVLHFHEERATAPPTANRLRAWVQGQVMFIGDYWLIESEARGLRDWISRALPDSRGDFDSDLAILDKIRSAHRDSDDVRFLISFIDKLWAAYMAEIRLSQSTGAT